MSSRRHCQNPQPEENVAKDRAALVEMGDVVLASACSLFCAIDVRVHVPAVIPAIELGPSNRILTSELETGAVPVDCQQFERVRALWLPELGTRVSMRNVAGLM